MQHGFPYRMQAACQVDLLLCLVCQTSGQEPLLEDVEAAPTDTQKHDWLSFSNQRVNQYEEVLLGWNATRLCFVVLCVGLIAASCAWMQTV